MGSSEQVDGKKITPHGWQVDALESYYEADKQDFLAVVTPGGGKTIWGLLVATQLPEVQRLIVVCPTTEVKNQWEETAAKEFGIKLSDLDRCDSNHLTTTYQQVASRPELFAKLVAEMPSIVIFDEIHHASDKNSWGTLIQAAFNGSKRRLALTGTAFRSDSDAIPFITYEDGKCKPDFVYGYGEAVRDGICRNVIGHVFGGEVGWIREGEDAEKTATFSDLLKKTDRSARLEASLKPEGGFMRTILQTADDKLSEYPGEGGLVIANSTEHADRIATVLAELIGEKPVVVHSGLKGAHKRIDAFRQGKGKWLVSVQMVSEGVDIERLRVLVYVTKIATEMFLRQAVGRVVRRTGDAHVYFPAHEPFCKVIDEIEHDRFHVIDEPKEMGGSNGGGGGQKRMIEATFSRGWEVGGGEGLSRDEPSEEMERLKDEAKANRSEIEKRRYEKRKKTEWVKGVRERQRTQVYKQKRSKKDKVRWASKDQAFWEDHYKKRRDRYAEDPDYRESIIERNREQRRINKIAKALLETEEAKQNGWDLKKCREVIREREKGDDGAGSAAVK